MKALVDAGADMLVKKKAGHDVAFEAEIAGKEEVVNWLLSAADTHQPEVAETEEEIADNAAGENNLMDEQSKSIQDRDP